MGWKGTRRVGGRQSNWLAYFEVYRIGFVFVTPQALGHQFSVDEGHVWLGWGIRSGGRICLIRSQQNISNVGDGICAFGSILPAFTSTIVSANRSLTSAADSGGAAGSFGCSKVW